jgi:hypothetical protein
VLHGASYPLKNTSEIGNIDHRQQQAGYPKGVLPGKHSQQAEYGYDLVLYLLLFFSNVLGQGCNRNIRTPNINTKITKNTPITTSSTSV